MLKPGIVLQVDFINPTFQGIADLQIMKILIRFKISLIMKSLQSLIWFLCPKIKDYCGTLFYSAISHGFPQKLPEICISKSVAPQEYVFKSEIRLKVRKAQNRGLRAEDLEFSLFGLFNRIFHFNTSGCPKVFFTELIPLHSERPKLYGVLAIQAECSRVKAV